LLPGNSSVHMMKGGLKGSHGRCSERESSFVGKKHLILCSMDNSAAGSVVNGNGAVKMRQVEEDMGADCFVCFLLLCYDQCFL
jgi:hypothetical protein